MVEVVPPITKLLTNGARMTCHGGHINRVAAKKIDEAGGRVVHKR